MTGRIAITCVQMQNDLHRHRDRLEAAGYELVVPEVSGQRFDADGLIQVAAGCVGLIAGDDDLGRRSLEGLPDLKVLVRWGIGTDTVDFDAAKDLGVSVRNTPGVFGEEVADSAFGYILNLTRGHHRIDAAVRRGAWEKFEGTSLHGDVLGVVGGGSIGSAVIRRGVGFGMEVLVYDPFLPAGQATAAQPVELSELLARSLVVVLTAPATDGTRGMIDAQALSLMRPDAFLVNVARGELVVEDDLVAALRSGRIAGAGLDVFAVEPLPIDSPLRELNVVLGSHNGSNTRQGVERASQHAVDILLEELAKVGLGS